MDTHKDEVSPERQIIEILLPDMRQFCLSPAPRVFVSQAVDAHVEVRDEDYWSDDIDDITGLWLLDWLACAGDVVQAGEPLAELRMELCSFAIVAPIDGVLSAIVARRGVVTAGSVLAVMRRSVRVTS